MRLVVLRSSFFCVRESELVLVYACGARWANAYYPKWEILLFRVSIFMSKNTVKANNFHQSAAVPSSSVSSESSSSSS